MSHKTIYYNDTTNLITMKEVKREIKVHVVKDHYTVV